MPTLRLVVEYDGTAYSGWQIQEGPGAPETVQGVLERALRTFCDHPVRVRGASRTDAGVHARGQVVAFETDRENIPAIGFERGLRRHLPPDIAVRSAERVACGWDPRRTSRGKRYIYTLYNHPNPSALLRDRAWWIRGAMDAEALRAGARNFLGTHDFEAFRAVGCVAKHAVRTVHDVELRGGPAPEALEIVVLGNAFVRNMVRIMAGTLVEVGLGRRAPESVAEALVSRRRADAGVTAPPQGLCLDEVIYDDRLPPRPKNDADLAPSD